MWLSDTVLIILGALGLVCCSIIWAIFYYQKRTYQQKIDTMLKQYVNSLHFLTVDRQEKALDVVVDLLKSDADMIESQFLLGQVYRQRGDSDKAIMIHQSLLSQMEVTADIRSQTLLELGLDYLSAGLLDRAEGVFIELSQDASYTEIACRQLCLVHERTQNWLAALNTAKKIQQTHYEPLQQLILHYHCELAEEALHQHDIALGHDWIKAEKQWLRVSQHPRLLLLEMQLMHVQQNDKHLYKLLRLLVREHSILLLAYFNWFKPIFETYQEQQLNKLFETLDYKQYPQLLLLVIKMRHCLSYDVIQQIDEQVEQLLSQSHDTFWFIWYRLLQHYPFSGQASALNMVVKPAFSDEFLHLLRYHCRYCGYTQQQFFWRCPSCEQWDSVELSKKNETYYV